MLRCVNLNFGWCLSTSFGVKKASENPLEARLSDKMRCLIKGTPLTGSDSGRSTATMRVEESIEIDKPVEEVFDYLFEVDNFPEWSAPAIDVRKDAPGTLKEGSTFTVVVTFLGRRFELPYEVTDYDPLRHYAHKSTGGPIPNQWSYTFEEVSGGTRLSRVAQGEPGGFFRVAEPLFERVLKRQVRADLETVKDLLEAQSSQS